MQEDFRDRYKPTDTNNPNGRAVRPVRLRAKEGPAAHGAAAAVRHIFDKCGGSLGTTNCVSYMFESKGVVTIAKQQGDDDEEL